MQPILPMVVVTHVLGSSGSPITHADQVRAVFQYMKDTMEYVHRTNRQLLEQGKAMDQELGESRKWIEDARKRLEDYRRKYPNGAGGPIEK
jgi:hypothetical protein